MPTLVAGALYFLIVFVVAFALGTVRTFWLEPTLGETLAVACETPVLIVAMYFAARWVPLRTKLPLTASALLAMGLIALLLQQIAELALVLAAGETIAQHLEYLLTLAGMIYLFALAVFVLMPLAAWKLAAKR